MDAQAQDNGVLEFGAFRIDTARRHLTCNGVRIKITPRLFETLSYFAANAGRIVEKDELMQAVWGGRIVEDANLSQTIFALRKMLRDEGGLGEAILTEPGRGYRFVLPVRREAAGPLPQLRESSLSVADAGQAGLRAAAIRDRPAIPDRTIPATPAARGSMRRLLPVVVVALALGAAGAGALALHVRHPAPPAEAAFAPPPHSVAVLAFANMTGDPAREYFSDGLAEELIQTLGAIQPLRVAARVSAFSFKGTPATAAEIGRKLNVGAILEGAIRRDGTAMRISVSLIDTVNGFALWTHSFDHAASDDPLRVESNIAAAVATAVRADLSVGAVEKAIAGGTHNAAAFDAYLAGATELQWLDIQHDRVAIADFRKAIGLDPTYALPYAGLAAAEVSQFMFADAGEAANLPLLLARAREDADRAIALQPGLAEAHREKARVLEAALDMRGAAAEMARAHDLAPGNTVILEDYGALLAAIGHADAAIAAGREAVSLDPLGARTFRRLGNIYWSTRHYAEAIVTLQLADAMDTHPSPIKRLALAEAYLANGQPEQALPLCEPIEVWDAHVCLAIAYHALGRSTDAERQLQLVHKELGDDGAFMYAQIHAQWGEPEAALRWLEVAYRLHDSGLNELRSSPYLAPIRDTGGFKDIERRLDFPP